jgi:hypothetical protein
MGVGEVRTGRADGSGGDSAAAKGGTATSEDAEEDPWSIVTASVSSLASFSSTFGSAGLRSDGFMDPQPSVEGPPPVLPEPVGETSQAPACEGRRIAVGVGEVRTGCADGSSLQASNMDRKLPTIPTRQPLTDTAGGCRNPGTVYPLGQRCGSAPPKNGDLEGDTCPTAAPLGEADTRAVGDALGEADTQAVGDAPVRDRASAVDSPTEPAPAAAVVAAPEVDKAAVAIPQPTRTGRRLMGE